MKITLEQFQSDHLDIYNFLCLFENRENNHFLQDVYNHLSKKGEISIKQINGIRNSMMYNQKKEEREQLIEKHKDDEPTGFFVGKVRQRYDMTLKYVSGKGTSRGFYIHNFVDRDGNALMCFSDHESIQILDNDTETKADTLYRSLKSGDVFTCRATVNRHSINDFMPTNKFKQTVLNRIKYHKYLGNKQNQSEDE